MNIGVDTAEPAAAFNKERRLNLMDDPPGPLEGAHVSVPICGIYILYIGTMIV
jgi:hypothetical protein